MRRLTLIAALLAGTPAPAFAQALGFPENPLDGRILFETRGCVNCHAIGGLGGSTGPDLSRDHFFGSFLGLVSAVWNHIPEMNRQYRLRRTSRPSFTESEMLDLAGFIYYLRYLGEPGSVARGGQLLAEKECTRCHRERGPGPDLTAVTRDGSPVHMAQAMWNHGPGMQARFDDLGIRYPTLSGRDISDMSAYLQMAASHQQTARAAPGNPARGRTLFEAKNCSRCHASARADDEHPGPTLDEMDLQRSVTEIAALMWNHGPVMRDYMDDEGIEWPQLRGSEMADLVAYLYFLRFVDRQGDAAAGAVVFEAKGCATCHKSGNEGLGPDLGTLKRLDRPGRLAQLMWNHAEEMEDLLIARNAPWPRLDERDLQNLLAYLRDTTNDR